MISLSVCIMVHHVLVCLVYITVKCFYVSMVWHNVKVNKLSHVWQFIDLDLHTTHLCTTFSSNNTITLVNSDSFYRAALHAGRSFLWASVCLSVKRVNCDKTKAPSKKSSIMTNRTSPTSFPMSLRWTAYVDHNPSKEASKTTIFSFSRQKIGLSSKKICYKVSLCENL